jgi:hypothetical protein
MSTVRHNIVREIQKLLLAITSEQLPEITVDTKHIDNIFDIIDAIRKNKPININAYTRDLLFIVTDKKCIKCHRNANYQNSKKLKDIYCWIHSQDFN